MGVEASTNVFSIPSSAADSMGVEGGLTTNVDNDSKENTSRLSSRQNSPKDHFITEEFTENEVI